MTPEEIAADLATKLKTVTDTANQFKADLDEMKKNSVSKEDLQKAEDTYKAEMQKLTDEKAQLRKEFDEMLANVSKMKTEAGHKGSFIDEVKENVELLVKALKGTEKDEYTIKAETNRASIDSNEHAQDIAGIGQLAHRKLSMYDLFPKIPIGTDNDGTVRYYDWDEATIARAATTIAESGTFPESTAKWKTYTLQLRKVGDSIPMTEEFMYDAARFAAEIQMFLISNVDLIVDDQLLNGDNTGNNLKGLITSIGTYTATASGISDASIYDLVVKVSESITSTGGSKYRPNFALMNITDINAYKLKKDNNNNYVMPPFVSQSGLVIDGLLVVECNILDADTMVVGDNRFARIFEEPGIKVSKGVVNTDFLEDVERLKVRRRLNLLVRAADAGGFSYVESIATSLTTLGSV